MENNVGIEIVDAPAKPVRQGGDVTSFVEIDGDAYLVLWRLRLEDGAVWTERLVDREGVTDCCYRNPATFRGKLRCVSAKFERVTT